MPPPPHGSRRTSEVVYDYPAYEYEEGYYAPRSGRSSRSAPSASHRDRDRERERDSNAQQYHHHHHHSRRSSQHHPYRFEEDDYYDYDDDRRNTGKSRRVSTVTVVKPQLERRGTVLPRILLLAWALFMILAWVRGEGGGVEEAVQRIKTNAVSHTTTCRHHHYQACTRLHVTPNHTHRHTHSHTRCPQYATPLLVSHIHSHTVAFCTAACRSCWWPPLLLPTGSRAQSRRAWSTSRFTSRIAVFLENGRVASASITITAFYAVPLEKRKHGVLPEGIFIWYLF